MPDINGPNSAAVHAGILTLLDANGVEYRTVHHQPTYTSEQSAAARGEDMAIGGKSVLLKVGNDFRLFVLSATLRIDSGVLRRHFEVRKTRFASQEELLELTGLVPGSVPPFGRPILPFDLYVDDSIRANDRIAFNAGSLTDSIIFGVPDYLRIVASERFAFSQTCDK